MQDLSYVQPGPGVREKGLSRSGCAGLREQLFDRKDDAADHGVDLAFPFSAIEDAVKADLQSRGISLAN